MITHRVLTLLASLLSSCIHQINGQDLYSTGSTLSLNGIAYYVPGKPFASGYVNNYASCASGTKTAAFGLVPVTVVHLSSATFNLDAIETLSNNFGEQDDVWEPAFLSGKDSRFTMRPSWFMPTCLIHPHAEKIH